MIAAEVRDRSCTRTGMRCALQQTVPRSAARDAASHSARWWSRNHVTEPHQPAPGPKQNLPQPEST